MPGVKDLKPRGTEMTRPSVLFGKSVRCRYRGTYKHGLFKTQGF